MRCAALRILLSSYPGLFSPVRRALNHSIMKVFVLLFVLGEFFLGGGRPHPNTRAAASGVLPAASMLGGGADWRGRSSSSPTPLRHHLPARLQLPPSRRPRWRRMPRPPQPT